jgi:hypothetical protein
LRDAFDVCRAGRLSHAAKIKLDRGAVAHG